MEYLIVSILPWILSVGTIVTNYMAGNKDNRTWIVGLVNQVLWSVWVLYTGTWGLLPLNIFLWIIYTRNHIIWNRQK